MQQWSDDGVVLRARPHGEKAAVVTVLTRDHGRHAGFVHGAASSQLRGVLQPGNRITAAWSARLAEQLGTFRIEAGASHAPGLFDEPLKLAGLMSAAAVADGALPEREPHPGVHDGLLALIELMERTEIDDVWIAAYVRWELGLLAELGFALDLERCAATGRADQLAWVSPRSGRAVSLEAGEPWADRLLALPGFLGGCRGGEDADIGAGLALTGHFLARHVFGAHGAPPPAARMRFVEQFAAGG